MPILVSALTVLFPICALSDTQRTDIPFSYSKKLTEINQRIERNIGISKLHPSSWLNKETIALAYLDRARLTANFNDYVAAKSTVDTAFELANPKSGPKLTRATLNYSIHRLPLVEADLAQAESALLVSKKKQQTIDEIRADMWLNTGMYQQAKQAYDTFEANSPSVTSATRLANYYRETADYETAEQWLITAKKRNGPRNPQLRSWINLQHGILDLDRGRLQEALAHYQRGLIDFSGYWLLEEHIAEIHVLQGNDQLAELQYRDLIQRTDSPQFMSALADILMERTDTTSQTEAHHWLQKAGSAYQHRLRVLPEMVAGHALDYFLTSDNRELTLQLALNNYGLRPAGESALQLVQAYSVNKQLEEADALLSTIFNSAYRSADLHATASVVYQSIDKKELSKEQQQLAQAINPLSIEDIDWLRQKLFSEP